MSAHIRELLVEMAQLNDQYISGALKKILLVTQFDLFRKIYLADKFCPKTRQKNKITSHL